LKCAGTAPKRKCYDLQNLPLTNLLLKTELLKSYPDRYYIDDLGDYNSVKPRDELSWIDDIEAFDAFMD
jgi:hypothetical protein